MSLGYRIQQLRKQRKMSQEELGERLEVTRQTVSKWELEQSTPDLDYISAISDLFEVTTDYLIKGELEPVNAAKYSASVSEKNSENGRVSYCEKAEGSGIGESVVSLSEAQEKYVITLTINFKSVFKIFGALATMFLGFFGCLTAISVMSQSHSGLGTVLGFSFLFVVGAFVFIIGLSAFAEPLMRFSKWLNRLFSYIQDFGRDFTCTFKKVKEERMSLSGESTAEKAPEITYPAAERKKHRFSKKLTGLLLIVSGCYISVFLIYALAHFFDGAYRNYFLFALEIIILSVSLIAAFIGLKMFLHFPKILKVTAEENDTAENKTERIAAASLRREEKALKIKEQAEIKAAIIMEKNRLKAEKIAPVNEAKAERIIEKSRLLEAQILEKAEIKADFILNGHNGRGGAHVK